MTTRVVFLDALDTMVELEPPWIHLAEALGVGVDQALVNAVRIEMGYYRDHAHEGRDEASLSALRSRCAELLSRELGREVGVETMMSAIRFAAFPDAAPALRELRSMGLKAICVSNWDVSLTQVLGRCGLVDLLDAVVTSADVGARKPDPAAFRAALEIAGCEADEAIHVGDSPGEDIAGAKAAGVRAVLIDRQGEVGISSLAEIAVLIANPSTATG